MDLDALAGVIAYNHTGDSVATVTAAVDRITIEHPLMEICDLELSGQVTYATGRSSMEISLQVAKIPAEGQQAKPEDVLITCAFTMVALDPVTKKYDSQVIKTALVVSQSTNACLGPSMLRLFW
jgi:acyl-coenzyme A thioesterase 9